MAIRFIFVFCIQMLALSISAQTANQTALKSKQALPTPSLATSTANSIEPSLVVIEDGSGNNFLGYCIENGYTNDGKNLKSSWIITTSINSKEDIYIKYSGVKVKAELKYTDLDADISILFIDNTVIKKSNYEINSNSVLDKNTPYFVTNLISNKISFTPVSFDKKIKISAIDFIEITSKTSNEKFTGGLFNASGIFLGIPSKKFRSSENSLLVFSTNNIIQIREAYFAAEIIKILAIDEKYRNYFGSEFVKWLYKGGDDADDKYLRMYKDTKKTLEVASPSAIENHQKALFDIAMIFYNSKNKDSITQKTPPKNVNLICQLSNQRRDAHQQMTFVINFVAETVNGYKATITDTFINYSYLGGDNLPFTVKIDRVGGYVNISTAQFPMLMSGPCAKSEGRVF